MTIQTPPKKIKTTPFWFEIDWENVNNAQKLKAVVKMMAKILENVEGIPMLMAVDESKLEDFKKNILFSCLKEYHMSADVSEMQTEFLKTIEQPMKRMSNVIH